MTGRARLQLASAGALAGAAAVAASAAAGVLGASWRPVVWSAVALVALAVLGALAGGSVVARRSAGRAAALAGTASGVATAVLLAVAALVLLLGRLPDRREDALAWPVVAGLVVAALGALRLRTTPRRLPGGRTPQAVLEQFAERSARSAPLEDLLLQLAEALQRDLSARSVEIWTRSGDGLQRLVAVPHRTTTASSVDDVGPLRRAGVAGEAWLRTWLPALLVGRDDAQLRLAVARHGSEVLGLVVVERPRDGERFSPRDERRLGDVVGRLGLALHNRQLDSALQATLDDLRRTNEELRASRARLVAAADAERRRIERDIHDGAQQHLVALAVNLGLSRDMLRDDPDAAAEVLEAMSGDLKETIAQLRALAHGIYPPLLRESGLAEALRSAAARSPQPVDVVAGELGRYGPDVEAAVYFCCLEALQNSAKHAAGSPVRVDVAQDGGLLRFRVVDEGPGFDPAATPLGQGLQNMTDRLGAVGGTVSWTAAPGGGTCVAGEVPVPVRAPEPVLAG